LKIIHFVIDFQNVRATFSMMIARVHERRLAELVRTFPVVAVIGPRQVGKSTLVQRAPFLAGRRYITLDDFDILGLAERDPHALLEGKDPVTVDEVQRCPSLLRIIKAEVDRDRRPGRFILTGSSDLNLTANLASELAGRVGVLSLPPLMWRELACRLDSPSWLEWLNATEFGEVESALFPEPPGFPATDAIFLGGYPLSVTASNSAARREWLAAYRFTYLERDVRQVSNIGSLADFARLFQALAGRSSQLLNTASLSRDVGLKAATTGRYLSTLEVSFQIQRLAPWFSNMGKRLVKSPKVYWRDTGMLCHLLGFDSWADAVAESFDGPLVETFIMMEILKQVEAYAPDVRVYFVRSHDGLEVDGLLVRGLKQLPFEIKASLTARTQDAAPLEKYMDLSGKGSIGLVFYRGAEYRRLSRRVLAVPFTALLA
jgi:predicted AAA+ superfamily ATPase